MSKKITGEDKPANFYVARYGDHETGAVGAEIRLRDDERIAGDHLVIIGRNGIVKDAGIIVPAKVNDVPLSVEIDTGAAGVIVVPKRVKKHRAGD